MKHRQFDTKFYNPSPMSSSASKSHLSTITPDKLNNFVQTEVEPDTEYISRCNAVVDRLSSFIKNNFPDDLKPSSVLKVCLTILYSLKRKLKFRLCLLGWPSRISCNFFSTIFWLSFNSYCANMFKLHCMHNRQVLAFIITIKRSD